MSSPPPESGEQRLLQRELAAERIDGGDAELRRHFDQIPAERSRAPQRNGGECLHRELVNFRCFGFRCTTGGRAFQFRQDAVPHLGRGRLGESDSDDLGGIFDLAQQAQKPARQQVGFAGARGRLYQDGAARVERGFALSLIGRSADA